MSNGNVPNLQVEKFPIRFVPAKRGVMAEGRIDDCVAFPHKDDQQPAPWSTHMVSRGFRLKDKAVMFVRVHELVAEANPPAADSKREDSGKRHEGKRRDKKNRDQRGDRKTQGGDNDRKAKGGKRDRDEDRAPRTWSFGPKVVEKQETKPATIADAFDRAKGHLTFEPGDVSLANLQVHFAHTRAQTDQVAIGIRTGMARMVARIEQLQQELSVPAAILGEHSHEACSLAEKLHHARKEREQLKAAQAELSAERLAALGQRGKALKAAGENADPNEVAVVAAIKEAFAKRQAPLSANIAANKVLIEGTKGEWLSGLEEKTRWEVGGLNTLEEATRIFDEVMKAVADAFTIHAEISATKNKLVGQVNAYEKRLAALA